MLTEDVEAMIAERDLDRGTEENYRRSVRFYSEWLRRQAERSDLSEDSVNRWLRSLEGEKSKSTILGHKRSITAVWNWLASQRLVDDYHPNRLRSVKVVLQPPKPWSPENVRALLTGAKSLSGRLRGGLLASELMTAWIHVGYETGMRPKDMRLLTRSCLRGTLLVITQNKTKRPACWELSRVAMESLKPLLAVESDRIFVHSRNTLRRWELRLYEEAAKHGFTREKGCGIGTLRKTAATETCRHTQSLEAAARLLGHCSGTEVARKYYVSPDALQLPPRPPSIFDAQDARPSDTDHPRRAG